MSPADALDRYFAAWNDHDPDAVVRSLTGGGSYEDATIGRAADRRRARRERGGATRRVPDLHFDQVSMAPPETPRPLPSA